MPILAEQHFSLGFNRWTTIENSFVMTVNVFYTSGDSKNMKLTSKVLFTINLNATIDWSQKFADLNLNKCFAAIVDFDLTEIDDLNQYLILNGKKIFNP